MSRPQSAHPVPVADLVPRVRAWAAQLRRWPSQNQVQAEFRVGVGKARKVLATLRESGFDPTSAPVPTAPVTEDPSAPGPVQMGPVQVGPDTGAVVLAPRRLHSVSHTDPDTDPDTVLDVALGTVVPAPGPVADRRMKPGAGEVFALDSVVAEPVPGTGHPESATESATESGAESGAGSGAESGAEFGVPGTASLGGSVAASGSGAAGPNLVHAAPVPARAGLRRWRLVALALLSLPAFVAIWGGWVGLGRMAGFGDVVLLPGIADDWVLDSAITLPIGVETYAAFALGVWLAPSRITDQARRFAMWSALGALGLGMAGQVAYHLMSAAAVTVAPWLITTVVACLPVGVLGCGAALAHLLHINSPKEDGA